MASKWWNESCCWKKLGNLDTKRALQVLRYCDQVTLRNFRRELSRLVHETSINGERLIEFVTRNKPIVNLILCGGMHFENDDEVVGTSSKYEHIWTKDSLLFSHGFHAKFCECFLLSVLGRQGAWKSNLKDITLDGKTYPLSTDEMVALCSNLRANSIVRTLDLRNQSLLGSTEGCRLLGQALRTNSALEKLFLPSTDLTSKGVEQLMYGLQADSMSKLKVLDLSMNDRIGDSGVRHIANMLENNKNLKILHLKGAGCGCEGARHFSSAFLVNSTLELFSLGANPITEKGMKLLLSSLTPALNTTAENRSNSSVKHLELEHMSPSDFSVESLAMMLWSNRTLESLNVTGVLIDRRDWIELVIPALYENNTLKYLAISGSNILPLDDILELITSMMRKTLRRGVVNRSGLKAQRSVRPQLGRIIMCGYQFAGKTTICKTLKYLISGPPAFHHCKVSWKKLRKRFTLVQKRLCGTLALGKPEVPARGCDVVRVRNETHTRIDVWDFAGQKEYHALYNNLFSNFSNSCFLCVCSAVVHIQTFDQSSNQGRPSREIKNQQDIQKEFEYWIRFITSKSSSVLSGIPQEVHRPCVILVLTNKDELDERTLHCISKSAENVVAEMKEKYHSAIDLQDFIPVVDSHCCEDVQDMIRLAEESLGAVFQRSKESAVCKEVRLALEHWSERNAPTPFLTMEDFKSFCEEELGRNLHRHIFSAAKLHSREGQVAMLNQLNNVGEVILTCSHDLLVVNARRFGLQILGLIIKALRGARLESDQCAGVLKFCGSFLNPADHGMGLHHERGFVRERQLKELGGRLEYLAPTEFLNLLIHFELCFETKSSRNAGNKNDRKVFVPSVFDDDEETALLGRRQLKWTENVHRHDFHYVFIGRRLQCDTDAIAVFTPGFFPKLQVFLHDFFMSNGWLENQAFQMDRNLIGFYENGVEVLVEYSGAVGYFMDILVKSSRSFSYTLDFIQANVLQQIRRFCYSSKGCPGVELVESIIRTSCVKELHLCVDRINQAVLSSKLHNRIKHNRHDYKFAWPESIHNAPSNVEKAVELLGGDLVENSNAPSIEANDGSGRSRVRELALLEGREDPDRASSSETPSMENITRRDLQLGYPPEISSQPLIERFRSAVAPYEQERQSTASPSGDHNISPEQHLPSLFYPTLDDVGYLSSLWARVEAKKAVNIHLMCESPSGFHEVADQQGRILNLRTGKSTIMEHVLTFIRHALSGTAQLAGMDVDAAWFQGLFGTSLNMPIKIEDLIRIKDRCNPSAPASDEEILASLAMYLKVERSTQWLKDFLNMENPSAFLHDFDLWRVKNLNTNSVAWVCVQHYMEAVRERNQLSIEQPSW